MSVDPRASILLVDDREENLVALRAILEPLGQRLVGVGSGDDALRELLDGDFAVILLDVQMPGLDGFETARLIKARERTRHVPIIFLTASSRDAEHVFRGYETGAVDYLLKPFDPEVLRSKVGAFVDLWRKERALASQEALLRERELAEAVEESEKRYRQLAEALPAIVWRADFDGNALYHNERWFEYTGIDPDRAGPRDWGRIVHPDDLPRTLAAREEGHAAGEPWEVEYRFRRHDGVYRWHLARSVPLREPDGSIAAWVGTAIDIDDRRRAEEAQRLLVEAGAVLGGSLDYEQTLADMARAAVPGFADWCTVDMAEPDGSLLRIALAHRDPLKVRIAEELGDRYPTDPSADAGVPHVVRTGEAELAAEIPDDLLERAARDELHLQLLRELGLRSYMCVPLRARGRVVGAVAFVLAESGRAYGPVDLEVALELARRAGTAIENAQLYEEAEEKARAALVLGAVADGVFMLDRAGVVRLWNEAAARITGLPAERAVGRAISELAPGWAEVAPRIPVGGGPGEPVRAETVPLEVDGRELWLSAAGVGVEEGTVYALRDLTDERVLEQLKSDFVATVSHEIRTPLAAVHGSALTLLRRDLRLEDDLRARLLEVIAEESDRLARIVGDLLIASHLDSGRLPVSIDTCDARALAVGVLEAAGTHLPERVTLALEAPEALPAVAADESQLRQVLANLVDNAVKYSPDGGPVRLSLGERDGFVRFAVADRGLGIPPGEHRRVFEKFYRLDPDMTRGIGGTGLGLYISRELVRTMGGRIWVESRLGEGSTFVVEIPVAETPSRGRGAARAQAA